MRDLLAPAWRRRAIGLVAVGVLRGAGLGALGSYAFFHAVDNLAQPAWVAAAVLGGRRHGSAWSATRSARSCPSAGAAARRRWPAPCSRRSRASPTTRCRRVSACGRRSRSALGFTGYVVGIQAFARGRPPRRHRALPDATARHLRRRAHGRRRRRRGAPELRPLGGDRRGSAASSGRSPLMVPALVLPVPRAVLVGDDGVPRPHARRGRDRAVSRFQLKEPS